jgi:hypothetical protein
MQIRIVLLWHNARKPTKWSNATQKEERVCELQVVEFVNVTSHEMIWTKSKKEMWREESEQQRQGVTRKMSELENGLKHTQFFSNYRLY